MERPTINDFWDDLYNLNGESIHYTGMLSLKQLKLEDCNTWLEEKWILIILLYYSFKIINVAFIQFFSNEHFYSRMESYLSEIYFVHYEK